MNGRKSPHGGSGRKSSCASAGGGSSAAHHSGWGTDHGRLRATVNRTWLHWPWCRIARPCHWHGNTAHAWCRCRNSLRGVHRRNGSAARLSRRAAPSFGLRPNLIPLANPSGPRVVAMPLPLGEQNHTARVRIRESNIWHLQWCRDCCIGIRTWSRTATQAWLCCGHRTNHGKQQRHKGI